MFPLIIMMFLDSDERSFMEKLYTNYYRLMIKTARIYVDSPYDLEEVVSDACIALINNISTLRNLDEKRLPAYITKAVMNKACDFLRREKSLAELCIPIDEKIYELTDTREDVESQVVFGDQVKTVLCVSRALPHKERQAFLLKYKYGVSCQQIAQMIGISEKSVYKYLSRAKNKIKEAIEGRK